MVKNAKPKKLINALSFSGLDEKREKQFLLGRKKLKPILPSLREKNRYLVFKVNSNEKLSFGDVKEEIENSCLRMLGELNMARAGLIVMDEWKNNKGIIKMGNKHLDEARASLLFIQQINGKKAGVESVYTSGLLNKAKERLN